LEKNYATIGYVNFLFGIFCANWAKNTNRSAWGWFFFGLFLAPIAGLVLVSKNNNSLKMSARENQTVGTNNQLV
jgi:hypothetical protein